MPFGTIEEASEPLLACPRAFIMWCHRGRVFAADVGESVVSADIHMETRAKVCFDGGRVVSSHARTDPPSRGASVDARSLTFGMRGGPAQAPGESSSTTILSPRRRVRASSRLSAGTPASGASAGAF